VNSTERKMRYGDGVTYCTRCEFAGASRTLHRHDADNDDDNQDAKHGADEHFLLCVLVQTTLGEKRRGKENENVVK